MLIYSKIFNKTTLNHRRNLHIYNKLFGKVSFNLSDIGEGIREVLIKEWFVKEGDKVSQFDDICEVQSDKASVTITSRYDGVISKLHYNIDETAYVGRPLVDIETDSNEKEEETTKEVIKEPEESSVLCIPSVRRLVKEYNVDVNKIKPTGRNGRILKEDVLKYLERSTSDINTGEKEKYLERYSSDINTGGNDRIESIKGFKKTMIKTMTEALKIPHFVYGDDIDFTEISDLRKLLKDKRDLKMSPLPFLVKAVSNSLRKYPIVNASVDENVEHVVYHSGHNIGIAMDTPLGLAVPVVKDVQNRSIIEISQEIQRLLKNGKEAKFSPTDLTGGTFTLSNIGSIGGTHLKPVILPPQVAIMAIGRSKILPRYDGGGNLVAREVAAVSASADHRIIDGATMARFVTDVKTQLENPYLLFFHI
ncbi:lipoamide acyltransferase component of branched-chain alpha-keto acid dehydrogenase complex, mitochondrial [Diorhabda carinulata]|uniref:lipoamide acyltransferase component of branched-chain alpha-keto acid dehydrogenase complex, mitochondrial n=1 Tax=Diorhabda carinulata TaxID=1163345 RepID=UPI0025A058B5|nr:lipoamide acyltransferase component of branched-chain alpha-keto acid dehydrogenase complex, mitochondrial [Diorhabda carinulata]